MYEAETDNLGIVKLKPIRQPNNGINTDPKSVIR